MDKLNEVNVPELVQHFGFSREYGYRVIRRLKQGAVITRRDIYQYLYDNYEIEPNELILECNGMSGHKS